MATESAAHTALSRARQLQMYRRALKHLPGGTDSNFRSWGEDTFYVDRGKGGRVWDIDGNEYIDLRMGYGPVILGHGDARVDDYVNERMRRGVSFSLTTEDEVRAVELVCELTGWVDMARMTVSGTEATMHAMRLARAWTGREKIVKFEGQYHGVHDYALISVGLYVLVAVGVAVLGTLRDSWRLTALSTLGLVVFTTFQSFAVFARIVEGAWLFVILGAVFLGTGFLFDRARRELAAGLEGADR